MPLGCTFTSRESPRSKAPSSSRPSSAGDRSTVRSQLRPRMSRSSLILNHRVGTQTSRRAARLTSAGAVSQTGQDDSKRDQGQMACHRLLRANVTCRHYGTINEGQTTEVGERVLEKKDRGNERS